MLHSVRKFLLLPSLMVLSLGLVACDPEEQDRILQYEKGTYLGQPDEELSPDTVDRLRNRARLQRGI
ncbi:MAG TPA: hypothetical protein VK035_08705 [Kiloniellales bacterium]|nr:hypothetical protein [Kiloniellales bacterium]